MSHQDKGALVGKQWKGRELPANNCDMHEEGDVGGIYWASGLVGLQSAGSKTCVEPPEKATRHHTLQFQLFR